MHHIEQWKTIENYPNYMVSNLGRVKRVRFFHNFYKKYYSCDIEKKQRITRFGYMYVKLSNQFQSGKAKNKVVHRLVAEAFIPNPDCKPEVNHINGDKTDNRAENLEWCDRSENMIHAYSIGHGRWK